ncbi:hypothetical protein X777_03942 [Ooceraea biroi]|uniref:Uncharacterized protein n=1 Tax=Ooceraea biroi TaxID=2015173 RepID=A0A026WIH1_OOCBI|nr:hypothetical protein X777_03942 [Ooceraea biroi]
MKRTSVSDISLTVYWKTPVICVEYAIARPAKAGDISPLNEITSSAVMQDEAMTKLSSLTADHLIAAWHRYWHRLLVLNNSSNLTSRERIERTIQSFFLRFLFIISKINIFFIYCYR